MRAPSQFSLLAATRHIGWGGVGKLRLILDKLKSARIAIHGDEHGVAIPKQFLGADHKPFVGLVQISSTPLRYALAPLKQKGKMSWFGRKGHLRSQIVGTMADQSRSGHSAEQRKSDG